MFLLLFQTDGEFVDGAMAYPNDTLRRLDWLEQQLAKKGMCREGRTEAAWAFRLVRALVHQEANQRMEQEAFA